jgi:DnaK suppressor protein
MRGKVKKKTGSVAKSRKPAAKAQPVDGKTQALAARSLEGAPKAAAVLRPGYAKRREALHRMLMTKRQETLHEIGASLGQSLTEDQQRRLESAMDVGDQALMDLERELGISLLEMRNRRRQQIDEALARLAEGTYGLCADCGVEISEKRLQAVPFAKLCVECQTREELLEKIEKGEERD